MKRFISTLSSLCLAATSLLGAASGITASAVDTQAAPSAATITYDLIPNGKTTELVDGVNVYNATAGEKLKIDWIVTDDPGTAGMQIALDFGPLIKAGGTYDGFEDGDAYMVAPEVNETKAKTTGEIDYAFGKGTAEDPVSKGIVLSFNVTLPADAKDTSYLLGLMEGVKTKVVPVDQNNPYDVNFRGLLIKVGTPTDETTAPPAVTTAPPVVTTAEPADTTPVPANAIVYNFVAKGAQPTVANNARGNNTVNAAAGETVEVDWLVRNDPGTAGIQMNFDISEIIKAGGKFVDSADGDCYMVDPEFNTSKANTTGELNYAFGKGTAEDPVTEGVIYRFSVSVPANAKDGDSYVLKLDESAKNKVVPVDQTKPYDFVFHGLQIVVGEAAETTTTSENVPDDALVYNFVASGQKPTVADNARGNNKVNVAAGDTVKVDWLVRKDPGTAGIQMTFDISEIIKAGGEYLGGEDGDCYMVDPEYNDTKAKTTGEINYAFGKGTAEDPVDEGVIYRFSVKVPENAKNGDTYVLKLNETVKNKVVPVDQTKPFNFVFHGLEIVVGEATETTTTPAATTPAPATTTTEPVTTPAPDVTTEAPDVTTAAPVTTEAPAETVAAGAANWTIGEKTVAAGADAAVPVTVSNDDGTAGYVVEFTYDPKLTFKGITVGAGYTGDAKATVVNEGELVVVWASDTGVDQKADGVVLTLNFTAPTEAGRYDVKFKTDVEAVNTDGNALKVTQKDGAVIVTAPDETIPAGAVNWTIGEKTVAAGADAAVPVTVSNDDGTAGYVVEFTYDPKLTFNGITVGAGYTGDAKATVVNEGELVVVWASDTGVDQKADGVVLTLNFTAPTEAGRYDVKFKTDVEAVNTDGNALKVTQKDGAVIVADVTTTPAPTTTEEPDVTTEAPDVTTEAPDVTTEAPDVTTEAPDVTTEAPNPDETIPAGAVNWVIGEKTVAAGADAAVPVTVSNDDGTAGFVVAFTYDPKLTFNGITLGGAYTGNATATVVNEGELIVVWASDEGTDQKGDGVVLTLNFTAPDEAGRYDVQFKGDVEAVNTDGNALKVTQQNGAVIVADVTTTPAPDVTTEEPDVTTTEPDVTTAPDVTTEAPDTTEPPVTTAPNLVDPENPGHVVYQIDDVTGQAGKTVKVPVYVWYDEGTSGFTMEFAVENGFVISGIEYGDAYSSGNNEYTWSPNEHVLVWASADGEAQTAVSGAVIANLLIDVPADAEDGVKYPVTFVDGSVSVSGPESTLLEHAEINGSITVEKVDAGDIVFNIGSGSGAPGESVTVPLTIGFTKGVSEFEIVLDVPDGLSLEDLNIDPDSIFAKNGEFTWDPETKTLKWVSSNGDVVADPNTKIADIKVKIGDDVAAGTELTISGTAKATNADGNDLTPHVTDGKITVNEPIPDDLYVVTSIAVDYKPPTRVNYWSHDPRTFAESNGLKDMAVSLTISKYYINGESQFVDAEGNVLSDTKYDPVTGAIPAGVEPFATPKTADVTAYSHPLDRELGDLKPENTPKQVWENEVIDQFGEYTPDNDQATNHTNKHTLRIYYFSDEQTDQDLVISDQPYYLGDYNIFIGVKGDTDLNNKVQLDDAQLTLIYYTEKVITEHEDTYLVANDGMGDVDELRYFLSDVQYAGKDGAAIVDPTSLDVTDAQLILLYYTDKYVTEHADTNWTDVVGYDLLDRFYDVPSK